MSLLKYFFTCVFLTEFLKLEVQKTAVISPLQGEIAGHFDLNENEHFHYIFSIWEAKQ